MAYDVFRFLHIIDDWLIKLMNFVKSVKSIGIRNFSRSSIMSIEYNVIVYDKPGVDRSQVRPQHFANIAPTVNKGKILSVGAIYHDDEKTKFAGSAYHILADNREEIIEFLKQDVYYTEGIWDINNVLINPIGIASRSPKKLDGVDDKIYKL